MSLKNQKNGLQKWCLNPYSNGRYSMSAENLEISDDATAS